MILNFEGQAEGISADDVIQKMLTDVKEDALAAA